MCLTRGVLIIPPQRPPYAGCSGCSCPQVFPQALFSGLFRRVAGTLSCPLLPPLPCRACPPDTTEAPAEVVCKTARACERRKVPEGVAGLGRGGGGVSLLPNSEMLLGRYPSRNIVVTHAHKMGRATTMPTMSRHGSETFGCRRSLSTRRQPYSMSYIDSSLPRCYPASRLIGIDGW